MIQPTISLGLVPIWGSRYDNQANMEMSMYLSVYNVATYHKTVKHNGVCEINHQIVPVFHFDIIDDLI